MNNKLYTFLEIKIHLKNMYTFFKNIYLWLSLKKINFEIFTSFYFSNIRN